MTMKHITIPAEKKCLSKGIDPIIALLEDEEADFALITKIELAIDEILTNVALYAYAPDKGNIDIDYGFDQEHRELTIVIADEGKPFDPLAKEDPDISLGEKERKIGGLGIFIVKTVMDEVTYERTEGKNVLTLKRKI